MAGHLHLFFNYRSNPQNIAIFMANILSINFTKVLSATWNAALIYDDVRLFGPIKRDVGIRKVLIQGIDERK